MFESILGLSSNQGMISGSSGSFNFDVVTIESHESNLRVTENPIETGSNISDHAVLEPKRVTINGVMVGYNRPPKLSSRSVGFDFPEFPLPFDVSPITDFALDKANDFMGNALNGAVVRSYLLCIDVDWGKDEEALTSGGMSMGIAGLIQPSVPSPNSTDNKVNSNNQDIQNNITVYANGTEEGARRIADPFVKSIENASDLIKHRNGS